MTMWLMHLVDHFEKAPRGKAYMGSFAEAADRRFAEMRAETPAIAAFFHEIKEIALDPSTANKRPRVWMLVCQHYDVVDAGSERDPSVAVSRAER